MKLNARKDDAGDRDFAIPDQVERGAVAEVAAQSIADAAQADAAIAASGTVILELALANVPVVSVY